MLRRGLAALMMGVICAGSVTADEAGRRQDTAPRTNLVGWLKARSGNGRESEPQGAAAGVERAVIADAQRQSAQMQVSLTANEVADDIVVVAPYGSVPGSSGRVLPVVDSNSPSGPYSDAQAGQFTSPAAVYPSGYGQTYPQPVPVRTVGADSYGMMAQQSTPGTAYPQPISGQYPQTGAALYPAPRPGIPHYIGGTMIPNQAFHPHEMLHAHHYRAMYPPYYYKVNGGFMVTPFGVWSHEDWKLQGTMVDVKYKSSISPFALYKRPVIR